MIATPTFANGSAGAEYVASNGEWLNVPDAVLFSNVGSNNQAILLSLQDPLYDEADKVGSISSRLILRFTDVSVCTCYI